MKIAMTGATGFIGTQLQLSLQRQGHKIVPLGRYDFSQGLDHLVERMRGCNAVINLAGEPINRRWTQAYKKAIFESRVETTRQLVEAMEMLPVLPDAFISTSAIDAFDSDGEYNEWDAPNASDFLGKLSKDWEAEARKAEHYGVRTLIFRFGLVLGHEGGLMKQMLPVFRLGLGGPVADGQQHFSWVHVDDLVDAYHFVLNNPSLSGVYHICSPKPVTNLQFTHRLGTVLQKPTPFKVPALMLRLLFGEGADVMTSGQRVVPERFIKDGFIFRYADLEPALEDIVEKAVMGNKAAIPPCVVRQSSRDVHRTQ